MTAMGSRRPGRKTGKQWVGWHARTHRAKRERRQLERIERAWAKQESRQRSEDHGDG